MYCENWVKVSLRSLKNQYLDIPFSMCYTMIAKLCKKTCRNWGVHMENEVYIGLFDITQRKMQQSGKDFTHPKAAFLYYCVERSDEADLSRLLSADLSNEELLECAYITLLDRFITESERESYSEYITLPKKAFLETVFRRIIGSDEQKNAGKRVKGCPDSLLSGSSRGSKTGVMEKLLPLYRRLPKGIKNALRRMLGGSE